MLASQSIWKVVGCTLALAACAPGIREVDEGFLPAQPAEESMLVVRNDNIGEMDIYTVLGSTRTRLGSVAGGRVAEFRLTRSLIMRPWIQFQLDPVGPEGPFTYQPITIGPGNVLELAVAPALHTSSYAIRVNQ